MSIFIDRRKGRDRRAGKNRRKLDDYDYGGPERRNGSDRRSLEERRNGLDRRKGGEAASLFRFLAKVHLLKR